MFANLHSLAAYSAWDVDNADKCEILLTAVQIGKLTLCSLTALSADVDKKLHEGAAKDAEKAWKYTHSASISIPISSL